MIKIVRIGILGDGVWAQNLLLQIVEDDSIQIAFLSARYNRPDQKLISLGKKNKINIINIKNINSSDSIKILKSLKCDLLVSMSYNQIIEPKVLKIFQKGAINCHAGKLPFYRGRSILNWVLINDEKEFGITVHQIDKTIDTGPIILQKTFSIDDNDDYKSILEKSYSEAPKILFEAIKLIQSDLCEIKNQKEIHKIGSYYSKRKVGDETIDWEKSSRQIFNFIRALVYPGPYAQSQIKKKIIKFIKSKQVKLDLNNKEYISGEVIEGNDEYFIIRTYDNGIKITDWEPRIKIKKGDRFT